MCLVAKVGQNLSVDLLVNLRIQFEASHDSQILNSTIV
jgi:hypothetical protein